MRTKTFKKWFGDWELAAKLFKVVKGDLSHGFKNLSEAASWAKDHLARTLNNEETGGKGEIRISNSAIRKYLSESAVSKSISLDAHLSALKVLHELIKESEIIETHEDRAKDTNISGIQRLYACMGLGDSNYCVKITLKKYADPANPSKAYSYEVIDIKSIEGSETPHDITADNVSTSIDFIIGAKLLNNVKNSKGEPILNCSKAATNKETGAEVGFFSSAFEKNHRDGGLFEKAIPKLKKAFENAVLLSSELDNRAGEKRPDGTVHKEHRSIESFENYIGKVALDGKDYYVRYTVQMQKGQNGIHSQFVSNIDLYDTMNPTSGLSYRDSSLAARGTADEIVDTKLQKFFLMSSKTNEEFEQRLQNWQYSSSRQSNLSNRKKERWLPGTYMKAPNGKPFKLHPEQWAQVRTRTFKKWFGDWEQAAKLFKVVKGDLKFKNDSEIISYMKENFMQEDESGNRKWKTFTNLHSGNVLTLSSTGINKSLSKKAKDQSVSEDAQQTALSIIDEIITNSILGETHEDRSGDPNIVEMQRYYGAINIDGVV